MLYIFCALKCEASPIINMMGLAPLPGTGMYSRDDATLVITGPGSLNVKRAFEKTRISEGDVMVNYGTAGCRDPSVPVGTLFLINEIRHYMEKVPLYPDMFLSAGLPEAACTTFDAPSEGGCPTLLADMEAYGFFARASVKTGPHSAHVLKIVSDHMDLKGIDKGFISRLVLRNRQSILEYIEMARDAMPSVPDPDMSAFYKKYKFTAAVQNNLDRLNKYHLLRYSRDPGDIYRGFDEPNNKSESMRIYDAIREKLI